MHYYRPVERGKPRTLECEVAVYGGTPGGVAAAIQAARMGRNPRTGAEIKIRAVKVPKFRPGKALKDALN